MTVLIISAVAAAQWDAADFELRKQIPKKHLAPFLKISPAFRVFIISHL